MLRLFNIVRPMHGGPHRQSRDTSRAYEGQNRLALLSSYPSVEAQLRHILLSHGVEWIPAFQA
jgi:hypothetical protein